MKYNIGDLIYWQHIPEEGEIKHYAIILKYEEDIIFHMCEYTVLSLSHGIYERGKQNCQRSIIQRISRSNITKLNK